MTDFLTNISVIVRSVNERTELACIALLEQEVESENLFLVNEVPFSKALKKSLQIGIERNKKWTICIDADILIRTDALKILVNFSEALDLNTFKIVPYFVDKFFNIYRGGGIHCYKTELLPQAIKFIPEEGGDLRPESQMFLEMEKLAYKTAIAPYLLAVHDYEQYYHDIYRKTYIYAHKWGNWISDFVVNWRKSADSDSDFRIALYGLAAGIATLRGIRINKTMVPYEWISMFNKEEIKEKEKLSLSEMNSARIEEIIKPFEDQFRSKVYRPYLMDQKALKPKKRSIVYKLVYSFGDLLIKTGKRTKTQLQKNNNEFLYE